MDGGSAKSYHSTIRMDDPFPIVMKTGRPKLTLCGSNPHRGDQKPGGSGSDRRQEHAPVNNGRKELLMYGVMNGSLQKGFLQPKGELGRSC